jgi:hypothetical protein
MHRPEVGKGARDVNRSIQDVVASLIRDGGTTDRTLDGDVPLPITVDRDNHRPAASIA